jgi:hypothetical protein
VPLRAPVNNAGIALGGPLEYLPLAELRFRSCAKRADES